MAAVIQDGKLNFGIAPERAIPVHQTSHVPRPIHEDVLVPDVHVQQARRHGPVEQSDVLIQQGAHQSALVLIIVPDGDDVVDHLAPHDLKSFDPGVLRLHRPVRSQITIAILSQAMNLRQVISHLPEDEIIGHSSHFSKRTSRQAFHDEEVAIDQLVRVVERKDARSRNISPRKHNLVDIRFLAHHVALVEYEHRIARRSDAQHKLFIASANEKRGVEFACGDALKRDIAIQVAPMMANERF